MNWDYGISTQTMIDGMTKKAIKKVMKPTREERKNVNRSFKGRDRKKVGR